MTIRVYLSPCHHRRVEPVTDIPPDEPSAVYCPSCGQAWTSGDRRLDWIDRDEGPSGAY